MKRRTAQIRGGYILFEAIAALAVLSIGLFGVQAAIRQATITRAQAVDFTCARFLLEQVMSEAEIQPRLLPGETEGQFSGEFERFRWKREIRETAFRGPDVPMPPEDTAAVNAPGAGRVPPVTERPRMKYKVPTLGVARVTIMWERAGRSFEASAETVFNPDKLISPQTRDDRAPAQ